ncbi:hypothetical protein FOA52_004079 [Chlamydomonas sp. UWO 241]|nr:hypothetical protein FOA52_004079 [Chlamydomonas sp. UWO 241]
MTEQRFDAILARQRFDAVLARQVPDEEKRRRADFVVDTSVSREETEAHVATLVKALRGRRGRAVAA